MMRLSPSTHFVAYSVKITHLLFLFVNRSGPNISIEIRSKGCPVAIGMSFLYVVLLSRHDLYVMQLSLIHDYIIIFFLISRFKHRNHRK